MRVGGVGEWGSAENQTPAPTTWPCPAMPQLDDPGRALSWTIQEDLRSTPTPGSASSGWEHAKQSGLENEEKDRFSAFWLTKIKYKGSEEGRKRL